MAKYKTRQGSFVEEIFESGKDYSCQDIVLELRKKNMDISIPTVYRHVARLVEEGKLNSYFVDGKNRFRMVSEEKRGAHLRCKICGNIKLLECSDLKVLIEHMKKDHGFIIDTDSLFFYGICDNCKNIEPVELDPFEAKFK